MVSSIGVPGVIHIIDMESRTETTVLKFDHAIGDITALGWGPASDRQVR